MEKDNSTLIRLFDMHRKMHFFDIAKQIFSKEGIASVFINFWNTFKQNYLLVFKLGAIISFFLFVILVIAVKSGVEPSDLSRDYNGVYHLEPYVGVLSSLGIFIWCGTVTLCWFAWFFIRKREPDSGRKNFFLVSGWITSIIAVDDLFQFHEVIMPTYLGIPEITFYIIYFLTLIFFNIKYINTLMNRHFSLLVVCYFLLAFSIIFDVLFEDVVPFGTYIEDGLKLMGITFWSSFFFKTVLLELDGAVNDI
jgi:hypothetical protein